MQVFIIQTVNNPKSPSTGESVKKIIVNGYNGILLCNKEELFIGTRNSVKESLSTALTEARYKGYICYGYI